MLQINSKSVVVLIAVSLLIFSQLSLAQEKEAPTQVLITNVNVWDGTSDAVKKADVLVEGNKIKKVAANINVPKGATTIDGKGGTLIPGLLDMHQHLLLHGGTAAGTYDWDAYIQGAQAYKMMKKFLYMGYTTIRDIGGNSISLSRAVRSGYIDGPRIYTSGPVISQTGGHGDWGSYNDGPNDLDYQEKTQNTFVVDGVDEVIKAVRWNFKSGASFIKIMGGGGVASVYDPLNATQLTFEEMKAAVDIAEDYGSYVAIHAYHDRSYNRALDAGVKSFEHGFLITEKTVKRMAETEGVFWSWQPFGSYTLFAGGFPEWFSADMIAKGTAVNKGSTAVPKLMKKHGVPVVLGSDMFGDEAKFALTNIISASEVPGSGYTSLDIMKMATSNAGKVCAMSGPGRDYYKEAKLGVVEEGAWADVLIINGNPVKDVHVLAETDNMILIMKDGMIYKNITVPGTDPNYKPIPKEFRVN
jgi:imidazolonepropionase-like amidohydrolase